MSNSWCPEIFRSIYVDRFNDDQIRFAPCCQAQPTIEPLATFDFATNQYLTSLREQIAQGKKPSECESCWKLEHVGQKSRRQSAIEFFSIKPNTDVVLESIDHSATWACNSACVMCKPQHSSMWATELNYNADELYKAGRRFQKANNFLEYLDVTNIKKVHFNGGEPLLNNEQVDLLEKLKINNKLSSTFVSYNTNGTVYPSQKILDLWAETRLVKLFFSLDAIGPAFNYIRWPGDWDQVRDNILRLRDTAPSNVMFGINATVGAHNLLEIDKMYQWFEENLSTNREGDTSDFCWQLANNFPVSALPQQVKNTAIEQLSRFDALTPLTNHVKYTPASSYPWVQTLDTIDRRRRTNWRSTLMIGKFDNLL